MFHTKWFLIKSNTKPKRRVVITNRKTCDRGISSYGDNDDNIL